MEQRISIKKYWKIYTTIISTIIIVIISSFGIVGGCGGNDSKVEIASKVSDNELDLNGEVEQTNDDDWDDIEEIIDYAMDNGEGKNLPAANDICTDSDGGNRKFVEGTVFGPSVSGGPGRDASDYCDPDNVFLREYYCTESNLIRSRSYDCTIGGRGYCFDGACVCAEEIGYYRVGNTCIKRCDSHQNNECQENEVCRRLYVRGDSTRWSRDNWYYCRAPMEEGSVCERTDQCSGSLACINQRCTNLCTDSDGGNRKFVAGTVVGPSVSEGPRGDASDNCEPDGAFLREYYCTENNLIGSRSYDCTIGGSGYCFEGACVCAEEIGFYRVGNTCMKRCNSHQNDECQESEVCRRLYVSGDNTRWSRDNRYYCRAPMEEGGICERSDQCAIGLDCINQRCVSSH